MGLAMLHVNEIAEAIRLLCQGTVRLTEDLSGSDIVTIGSNRLFEIGTAVEALDDATPATNATVVARIGSTQVQLNTTVTGPLLVSRRARLRLADPPVPELVTVAQGPLDILVEPRRLKLPAAVVCPRRVEQPPDDGTNKSYGQAYWFSVYLARPREPGEHANWELFDEVERLFSALMEDICLAGTAWYSQVTAVRADGEEQRRLREIGDGIDVVEIEVLARRLEPWPK
jgi:hypothetical protein